MNSDQAIKYLLLDMVLKVCETSSFVFVCL